MAKNILILGTYHFLSKKYFYKIGLSPIGVIRIKREINGTNFAMNDPIFKDHVMPLFQLCGSLVRSPRKSGITVENKFNFDNYIKKLVLHVCNNYKLVYPTQLLTFDWIEWMPKDLNEGYSLPNSDKMVNIDEFKIPLSPQHGDLKVGNAVWDEVSQQILLIDWELYSNDGSFILDYVDYRFRETFDEQISTFRELCDWVERDDDKIGSIASVLNVPQIWLKSIFLLDRCQRTMYRLCMSGTGQLLKNTSFYKENLRRVRVRYRVAHEMLSNPIIKQ